MKYFLQKNKIIIEKTDDFDIEQILECGQFFRFKKTDKGYVVFSGKLKAEITEHENRTEIAGNEKYFENFFDLKTDYAEIKKELWKFSALHEPIKAGHGIRILNQPFSETVICFIISANNNIKRFTKTIEQIDFENLEKYSEEDFKKMGCGYRAPYLVETIQKLKEMNFEKLNKLDNNALKKQLLTLSGVGPKVAACIMLFAYHRLDTAPVDTWIKKAAEQLGEENSEKILSHKYAGIAQQYIFYYLQHLKKNFKGVL